MQAFIPVGAMRRGRGADRDGLTEHECLEPDGDEVGPVQGHVVGHGERGEVGALWGAGRGASWPQGTMVRT